MQINSGQITPGASLFQALQSGPKVEAKPQQQKPVAEVQNTAAVQASDNSEQASGSRDFARGSLVNIQA